MSSRPRRSTLAPSRFSPSLEESQKVPSNRSSQTRQQSPAAPPPKSESQSSKKSTPIKKTSKQQTPSTPTTHQPEQQQEKPVEGEAKAGKSNLFVSKAGRLSIPSSKLSSLSFANFGRKCLSIGNDVDPVDTKRRSLLQSKEEPLTKKTKIAKEAPSFNVTNAVDAFAFSAVEQKSSSFTSVKAERGSDEHVPSRSIKSEIILSESSSITIEDGGTPNQINVTAKEVMTTTRIKTSPIEDRKPDPEASHNNISASSPGPLDKAPIVVAKSLTVSPLIIRRRPVTPLFEGRTSRNKSKPISELAPDLLPKGASAAYRKEQIRERQEAKQRRKTELEARRRREEAMRAKREQDRMLRMQIQYQRRLELHHIQEQKRESEPLHHLPMTELPSPANLLNRSARKSLSIKIDDVDSESSMGRRSSKSISSPAVFGKRYQAYGTKTTEAAIGGSRFYSRMERRKFRNPLACGLVPIKSDPTVDDYFYREILIKKEEPDEKDEKDLSTTQSEEIVEFDVDVLTDNNETILSRFGDQDDEILVKNPAFDCVTDIRTAIPEPSEAEEKDEKESSTAIDQILNECNRLDNLVHSHLKTLLFSIIGQRLIDLNTLDVVGGCSLFYSQTLKNATSLRDKLCLFTKKRICAIEDAHAYLLRRLPDEYLASYLNLLRFLKISGSSLTLHLLDNPVDSEVQIANEFIREFVGTKVVDPNLRYGKCNDIVPLPNVSLVLVYPQVSTPSQTIVKHAHENMFRNLLPAAVRCVEKVELKFCVDVDPRKLTHMCLSMIRNRVDELVKRRPDDHVFLAGWGISSLLNMQAIQKVQGVTGVLNFAFPLRSYFGFRGSVDDTICVSYCPSLFVIGELATNASVRDFQAIRENMICESGLVVVGGADNNLYVSPLVLSIERVSQHCVDRIILDHVIDFMRQLMQEGGLSAKERRRYLAPVKFPNAFDVDLNTLKGRASGFVPKLRQPKEQKKPKDSKSSSRLTSNPTTPLSSEPSSSFLSSPALTSSTTFHRQPPPLLSTNSSSSIRTPHPPTDSYEVSSGLFDARVLFDQALRRRTSLHHTPVAVCMAEPRPPTVSITSTIKKDISVPKPATNVEIQRMMSREAEDAIASITDFTTNENDEMDDSAF